MDHTQNAGSVCFVQDIAHPITLARKVMEDTPHVMLAGAGAEQYARELGMKPTNLLTEKARKAWEKWQTTSNYEPVINIENHDTIGLLALDHEGRLAGGAPPAVWRTRCTAAWATAPSSGPACMSMARSEGDGNGPR